MDKLTRQNFMRPLVMTQSDCQLAIFSVKLTGGALAVLGTALQGNLVESKLDLSVLRLVEAVNLIELRGDLGLVLRSELVQVVEHDTLLRRVKVLDVLRLELGEVALLGGRGPALSELRRRFRQRVVVLHVDAQVETGSVDPLVPVDLVELLQVLLAVLLLTEPVEEVLVPLLRRDRLVRERLHVVLHVRDEVVQSTNGALKVEEEIGALLIRHLAERVVG